MSLLEVIDGLKPEDGEYALVEIDTGEPLEEAAHILCEFDNPDEVVIPPDTDFETYALYDREGAIYTRETWPEPHSESSDVEQKSGWLPGWMRLGGGNY